MVFVIVIDPAGHAGYVGRLLNCGYERGATLRVAKALQRTMADLPRMKVMLTRDAGEHLELFHAVSYANHAQADLFIRLHIYRSSQHQPIIHVYQRVIDQLADFAQRPLNPYAFVEVDSAHRMCSHQTRHMGLLLCAHLQQPVYERLLSCSGLQGVPLVALKGLVVPGLLIEIGIQDEVLLDSLIEPLGKALQAACACV